MILSNDSFSRDKKNANKDESSSVEKVLYARKESHASRSRNRKISNVRMSVRNHRETRDKRFSRHIRDYRSHKSRIQQFDPD